ncbi:MAG: AAA family ATPase [bacterium]
MEIEVKNLGILKQANFSLGEMTIICGNNNTGKTYATYALFGFLKMWPQLISIEIGNEDIDNLLAEGVVKIDVTHYIKNIDKIVSKACDNYLKYLPEVFASSKDRFKETSFQISLNQQDIAKIPNNFEKRMGSSKIELFSIKKNHKNNELIVTLLVETENIKIPRENIKFLISKAIKEFMFGDIFPNPFISSAERTGAAIFRRDLNFSRNRILNKLASTNKTIDPVKFWAETLDDDYALPVSESVNFIRQLESISKESSFIINKHSYILDDFSNIIGGDYKIGKNDELYYLSNESHIKFTMSEGSSSVRSLLDIGFYLRHVVKPNDLLIIDEPELNLHPENQRKVARLFARLVNLGIKVFITTHSDYIIKELNTLIMLNGDKPHLEDIAKREKYLDEELILTDKIRTYIAEKALIKLEGNSRKTWCYTLSSANITPELGIEVGSFDKTINLMNSIQEEIIFGE